MLYTNINSKAILIYILLLVLFFHAYNSMKLNKFAKKLLRTLMKNVI